MRNILIHQYQRIELAIVWSALQNPIPQLIRNLEPLIPLEP